MAISSSAIPHFLKHLSIKDQDKTEFSSKHEIYYLVKENFEYICDVLKKKKRFITLESKQEITNHWGWYDIDIHIE